MERGRKRLDGGTIINVTREQRDLCRRRTEFLLQHPDMALQDLLANAYVQGLIDATEHRAIKDRHHGT